MKIEIESDDGQIKCFRKFYKTNLYDQSLFKNLHKTFDIIDHTIFEAIEITNGKISNSEITESFPEKAKIFWQINELVNL